MTQDEIVTMAREAGFEYYKTLGMTLTSGSLTACLMNFAALVAAAEREACAKICDETRYTGYVPAEDGGARQYYDGAAEDCAEQIRARGET